MGYADGEALILTRLRAMAAYGTGNSSRGDWLILNSGSDTHYAILRVGEDALHETAAFGRLTVHSTYNTVIELWQLIDTAGTPVTTLQGKVDDVVDELAKYPYLGDSTQVLWSMPFRAPAMQEKWLSEGGAKWAVWEVTVEWQEEKLISPAE